MLTVYGAAWCPHCRRTVDWLKAKNIPFTYVDMDTVDAGTEKRVTDANGGDDWVVPTLEYQGKWRRGQFFHEEKLTADLKAWGVL